MLREIVCEEFKQKVIRFNAGFNTVLGTESGDNSIGKSTFLLIIDFVLGGDTYAKSYDILRNVGAHDVCFAFEFDKMYYFARKNTESEAVWICNENYEKIKEISITEYREFLNEKYNLMLPDLTFRDAVGRYTRVYGKENYDEKHPLTYVKTEKDKKAMYALLKLFNRYMPVAEIAKQADESSEKLKAYTKAQTMSYITKIGKREYEANLKNLDTLNMELQKLAINLEKGIVDADSILSEKAVELKNVLSRLRKMRSSIKARLQTLNASGQYSFSITSKNTDELLAFFPNVNVKKLADIEQFHNDISKIFRKELKEERDKLIKELSACEKTIEAYEEELGKIIQNPNISKNVLQKHAELVKLVEKINSENEAYVKLLSLKEKKLKDEELLIEIENKQFAELASNVNVKMNELNDFIYGKEYKSPVIGFSENSYTFFTPDDTGTGNAYKGLVVFDLAVLLLTSLPLIVHDSIVLKQISDIAVEKILELYNSCGKQVIIAFDKQSSYSEKVEKILVENKVLELAPGNELFGRSWGKN